MSKGVKYIKNVYTYEHSKQYYMWNIRDDNDVGEPLKKYYYTLVILWIQRILLKIGSIKINKININMVYIMTIYIL